MSSLLVTSSVSTVSTLHWTNQEPLSLAPFAFQLQLNNCFLPARRPARPASRPTGAPPLHHPPNELVFTFVKIVEPETELRLEERARGLSHRWLIGHWPKGDHQAFPSVGTALSIHYLIHLTSHTGAGLHVHVSRCVISRSKVHRPLSPCPCPIVPSSHRPIVLGVFVVIRAPAASSTDTQTQVVDIKLSCCYASPLQETSITLPHRALQHEYSTSTK